MANPSITVPVALSCRPSATLTLPWFVQGTEYNPALATFKPLVNGNEAFGAVYDAIVNAKCSVDIICWGFQPSMYFKRGNDGQGTLPIGTLLEEKGKRGVTIRLLCWYDPLHLTDVFSENMQPGNNLASFKSDTRNSTQRELDQQWYARADLTNVTRSTGSGMLADALLPGAGMMAGASAVERYLQSDRAFTNLQFATRNFDLPERAEIAWRTALHGADSERSGGTKAANSASMGIEPTHHQKMVLIDYDDPAHAIGFVMGHNTLDEYWDTSDHSCQPLHPQMGRNGSHPRQDLSSRVSGPILKDLNTNFCTAWDKATGQSLGKARAGVDSCTLPLRTDDTPVMAQILRTQSQEGKRDIEKLYLQTANNVCNFIYIENQYFRWQPLADVINKVVAKQFGDGRDPAEHGMIYLFVVTNASNEAMGDGTVNTYRMLDALGRADTMQGVAKLERDDALQQQYQEANWDLFQEEGHPFAQSGFTQQDLGKPQALSPALIAAREKAATLKAQIDAQAGQPVESADIRGLKVHVCTLVPGDTPAGEAWQDTYVHAKLMIVDDAFMTLGSANLNTRSMEADSELNICHERSDITQPLRERLWEMHTKGLGVGKKDANGRLDAGDAYTQWGKIIKMNKDLRKLNDTPGQATQSPYTPLVEFQRDDAKRTYKD